MSTKNYLKYTVTDTPPTFSDVGDEYYSTKTNILYKKVVYSGTNVAWSQIVSTGADGNITLTGNSISFLANNKYPIYFGSATRPNTSNNIYVGINTSGYIDGYGGPHQGTNTLSNTYTPEANVSIYFQPRGWGGILTSIPNPTFNGISGTDGHPGGFRGQMSVDLQLVRFSPTSVASGQFSALLGGYDSKASGQASASIGGNTNSVSGTNAVAIGGQNHYVDSTGSVILGGNYAYSRGVKFYNVLTSSGIAYGSAGVNTGYAQSGIMPFAGKTTSATPQLLLVDGSPTISNSVGNRNMLILPNNSLFQFKGTMVATVTGSAANAAWTFEGVITRAATAASTTLLGIPTISVINIDSVALTNGWYFTITTDTTNGGLQLTVKGDATNTIRWYCKLETAEVTF